VHKNRSSALGAAAIRETFSYTLPAVILVAITIYIPFVLSGYYSLTEWNGISKVPTFIGLENFRQIFSAARIFSRRCGSRRGMRSSSSCSQMSWRWRWPWH
jgi:ABC-type sugar transport system permease subunit